MKKLHTSLIFSNLMVTKPLNTIYLLMRKNYLFCGSDASAVRASMIYSFIATCKACGIEPREWLEDVIRRIPEYENGRSDVTHLLPKNWKRNFNDCNQR